jgi:hypothetical protein
VICVTGELERGSSRSSPGGAVTYSIWLWSTVKARHVTASVSVFGTDVKAPVLSLCPTVKGHICSVGALPANQQFELIVTSKIGKNATSGEQIGVTINVQGDAATGGPLSPAEASVATDLGQPSSSPPTIGTDPPVTIPPVTDPGVPDTTITPGVISSLFPTVGPSSSPPSSSSSRPGGGKKRGGTKAVTLASSSPIDPKLIGGQLAGLAVLAAAITMVVARLSLRTPQPAAPAGQTTAAAPPPEPTAADGTKSTAKDASASPDSKSPDR